RRPLRAPRLDQRGENARFDSGLVELEADLDRQPARLWGRGIGKTRKRAFEPERGALHAVGFGGDAKSPRRGQAGPPETGEVRSLRPDPIILIRLEGTKLDHEAIVGRRRPRERPRIILIRAD